MFYGKSGDDGDNVSIYNVDRDTMLSPVLQHLTIGSSLKSFFFQFGSVIIFFYSGNYFVFLYKTKH
jgi:hypothetical protein